MKDQVQYIKAQSKLEIMENLIEGLSEYNNIANYYNIKNFKVTIDYNYDDNEECYKYSIKLMRGTINPKQILDLRIQYKEKINELLLEAINKITKKEYFCYTSFIKKNNYSTSFAIKLKNDIDIEFKIKDEEDKEFYQNIENRYKNKSIVKEFNYAPINAEIKEEVQKTKAIKTIELISKILKSIYNYNKIENYENKKQFKLVCSNYNNKKEDCYKYIFKIFRGEKDPEEIFEATFSIKDKKIVYNEIYNLLLDYMNKDEFIYNSICNQNYDRSFNTILRNGIILDFKIEDEADRNFFENFFNQYSQETIELEKKNLEKKYSKI